MKPENWKGAAELVGIGAIVASLIFVGLELRQSRVIALSEIRVMNEANVIAVNDAFIEDADIWTRGNSGEELTAADQEIFNRLVLHANDRAYHLVQWFDYMELDDAMRDQAVALFAAFLYEHPEAREVWAHREQQMQRYRDLVNPDQTVQTGWYTTVNSAIRIYEQNEGL